MTVTVETRSFTMEQKREHVLAYLECKQGFKAAYLAEHELTRNRVRRWQAAMADGDLGQELIPRQTGRMSTDDVAEIRRLQEENARLRAEYEKAAAQRDRAAAERDTMAKAADALGKAIDAMQKYGVKSPEDERS